MTTYIATLLNSETWNGRTTKYEKYNLVICNILANQESASIIATFYSIRK
jgi:hypothetical protein